MMSSDPTHSQFEWLSGDEATPYLQQAMADFENRRNAVSIAKRLRKSITPTQAALVMEQAQLRLRGRQKFALADQMLFTRRGLEQATGEDLARYKARYFAGMERVADICCGIGGDLLGLAGRADPNRLTVGVDIDPVTALFARHNVSLLPPDAGKVVDVQQRDFEELSPEAFDGWHLDPDRRQGGRTVLGHRFSPSLVDVFQRLGNRRLVAVKVAPATPPQSYFPEGLRREWIGDRRECKQQLLWWGESPPGDGQRTATVVHPDGTFHQFSSDNAEASAEICQSVGRYLHEPHPTVLAADLTDPLAASIGAQRICREIPYLVTEERVVHPLLASFEVLESMRIDPKRIGDLLQDTDVGRLEIKRRGIDQVTADRFARLKFNGEQQVTLILTRVGPRRSRRALLARRLVDADAAA